MSRLRKHENSTLFAKMRVYDGESLKESDPKARSVQEYKDAAGVDEGMDGVSTRFAFKVLAATFNHDTTEVGADPVHLMYVLEQAIRREQLPDEVEKRYLEFIKAELVPRYAEFIGHEIQKAYLESYSDYGQNLFDRYVDYADAWIEDQDFKDPDTGQLLDRELLNQELTKIEKPAGIANPKDFRNEVVKFSLAVAGPERRQESGLDQLREDPRSDREADILAGRRSASGDLVRFQEGRRNREEARRVRRADGGARLHRTSGPSAGRMVHAREASRLRRMQKVAMHIVDRRLNPGGKSLENRQRFLRRAKALVQGAVKKSSQDRDIKDVLEGGEVSIPLDGMNEPRFRREGGTRDMVLPGNKKFIEGDILPRSGEGGGGRPTDPGEGDGEDAFRFVLSRDEFVDLFLDDLELPDLAKRKLAEAESEGLRRAGYATSGSPANISVSRTVSRALARRVALRRPRPEAIEELEEEIAECDDARRAELLAELEAMKAKARRIPFIDPIDIRYRRFETCRSRWRRP